MTYRTTRLITSQRTPARLRQLTTGFASLLALGACGKDAPVATGPVIASIVLSTPATSMPIGTSLQIGALVRDVDGEAVTGANLLWTSRTTTTAAVNSSGTVTALAAGTARIVASIGSVRDSVDIIIVDDGLSISTTNQSFTPGTLTVAVGSEVRFLIYGIAHNVIFASRPGAPANIQSTVDVAITRRFDVPGNFPFDCTLHPGMSGEIIVQ